jgi:hypothetical protein
VDICDSVGADGLDLDLENVGISEGAGSETQNLNNTGFKNVEDYGHAI